MTIEKRLNIGDDTSEESLTGFLAGPPGVWGDDEILQIVRQQLMAPGRWFDRQNVEAGTADLAMTKRVGEGVLIDETATAGVDEQGVRLHQSQGDAVDEAFRLRSERAVQRNHITSTEEVIPGQARKLGILGGVMSGVGHDMHMEGLGNPGHGAADGTKANDAEGLSGKLDHRVVETRERGGGRPILGNGGRVTINRGNEIQQQRKGVLGDGLGGVSGDIANGHTVIAAGIEIDLIHTGGGGNNQPQVGRCRERSPGDGHLVGDDDLGGGDAFGDPLGWRDLMQRERAEGTQR